MACNHERIKSVNCRKFCIDCGAELLSKPSPTLQMNDNASAAEKAPDTQKTATRRTRKKS